MNSGNGVSTCDEARERLPQTTQLLPEDLLDARHCDGGRGQRAWATRPPTRQKLPRARKRVWGTEPQHWLEPFCARDVAKPQGEQGRGWKDPRVARRRAGLRRKSSRPRCLWSPLSQTPSRETWAPGRGDGGRGTPWSRFSGLSRPDSRSMSRGFPVSQRFHPDHSFPRGSYPPGASPREMCSQGSGGHPPSPARVVRKGQG